MFNSASIGEDESGLWEPSDKDVRSELSKILASPEFAASERLRTFIEFVVTETLAGRGASLKEAVIGNRVYGRDAAYDPRIDSTVRVEARRLRKKLTQYYASSGSGDSVLIELKIGSYQPSFRRLDGSKPAERGSHVRDIFEEGDGAHIAMMPFRAISADTESESFARGLTDELMALIIAERGVRVLSQLTVLPYIDLGLSSAELCSKLGVVAVLQGVVRQDSDILRVTMEYSSSTGFVVFSDRFEAPVGKSGALLRKIAATMRARLRLDSSKMRSMQIRPSAEAIEAHAKIYRARRLMERQIPSAFREALQIFTEIAETARDYSRGHSGIADCYSDMFRVGLVTRETALQHALPSAKRALEIDAESCEAHSAFATVATWLKEDFSEAEHYFTRATELNRSARALRLFGLFKVRTGDRAGARELLAEAREIEPLSLQQDVAEALTQFHMRSFASTSLDRDEDAEPLTGEALVYIALCRAFAGRISGTDDLIDKIEHAAFLPADLAFATAEISAWGGDRRKAVELLAVGAYQGCHYALATLAASAGKFDRARTELEQSLSAREAACWWASLDPRLDLLQGN